MIVLIPAYEPDDRLVKLVNELLHDITSIIIIDDGSGERFSDIFQAARNLGCVVLTHATNLGKGNALKTGFRYIQEEAIKGSVVCADCDGQHLAKDIYRIASYVNQHPGQIVLGSRRFTGTVPLRSRFGNSVTRRVFEATTGKSVYDTQTGLRGYSTSMLDWLCRIPGERFEYEMNVLLSASSAGYKIHEIPIETVYLEENRSSHFRPIIDSIHIYLPILKFSASSLASALIDFILLLVLQKLTGNLFAAVAGARLCSSFFNYSMNRRFVFSAQRSQTVRHSHSMPRYYTLALLLLMLNYSMMHLLYVWIGLPLILAKLLTEGLLFLLSFWSQRRFVYTHN